MRFATTLACICMLAACSSGKPGVTPESPGAAVANAAFPGALPASFSGSLPCADCPGTRHVVELHPNNVFVYRITYLGRDASYDDIGRWEISPDGRRLTLHGGREAPVAFTVKDAATIRKLDVDGREIESDLNYSLARAAVLEPIEPQLFMRGMYSYMADAGMFVECITGLRLPVAMEADNVALERAYSAARTSPGEPVLVSLEGRIAMRPRMEGAGQEQALVPLHVIRAWPGRNCARP